MDLEKTIGEIDPVSNIPDVEVDFIDQQEFPELILQAGYSVHTLNQESGIGHSTLYALMDGIDDELSKDECRKLGRILNVSPANLRRSFVLTRTLKATRNTMRRQERMRIVKPEREEQDEFPLPKSAIEVSEEQEKALLDLILNNDDKEITKSSISPSHEAGKSTKTTKLLFSVLDTKRSAQRITFEAMNQLDGIAANIALRTSNNPSSALLSNEDINLLRSLSDQLRQLADALELISKGNEPQEPMIALGHVFGQRVKGILKKGSEELMEEIGMIAIVSMLSSVLTVFGQSELASALMAYIAGRKKIANYIEIAK